LYKRRSALTVSCIVPFRVSFVFYRSTMQLVVKSLDGQALSYNVTSSETVQAVKAIVQVHRFYPELMKM
jgi:hypothetical protein